MTTKINLSLGNVPAIGPLIGNTVRVSGLTKRGQAAPADFAVEMIGDLSGVTYTNSAIIIYMYGEQATTFARSTRLDEAVIIESVTN